MKVPQGFWDSNGLRGTAHGQSKLCPFLELSRDSGGCKATTCSQSGLDKVTARCLPPHVLRTGHCPCQWSCTEKASARGSGSESTAVCHPNTNMWIPFSGVVSRNSSGRQVSRKAKSFVWRPWRNEDKVWQLTCFCHAEVPPGMEAGDYDVRLAFGEKIIHGAVPRTCAYTPSKPNQAWPRCNTFSCKRWRGGTCELRDSDITRCCNFDMSRPRRTLTTDERR